MCWGVTRLTQANRYSVKGHRQPRPCSQSSILWSKPQPTWEADGRIWKERNRRWTSTGVGLPNHTTLAGWFTLLKDHQCCHGHQDMPDATATEMIRSRQRYLGATPDMKRDGTRQVRCHVNSRTDKTDQRGSTDSWVCALRKQGFLNSQ